YYVVISNDCQPSIEILNNRVFEVTKLQFLKVNESTRNKDDPDRLADERFVQMLREASSNQKFYCSRTYDLSSSFQENFKKSKNNHSIYNTDPEFIWNWHLMSDALNDCKGLEQYLMPLINGYCDEYNRDVHYIIVSRRSRYRAGVRYYRRGVDKHGNVGNFVQTEQILCTDNTVFSHLQLRGSIPVFWTQKPNLMYKPQPCISNKNHDEAFELHFNKIHNRYGRVTIVSLIDHNGSEMGLSDIYRNLATRTPQLIYREFDFHYHSGQIEKCTNILLDMVKDPIDSGGYCVIDIDTGKIKQLQTGIIRTNCMDSLDRTNVVQSMIAKVILEKQMTLINNNILFRYKDSGIASAKLIKDDGTINLPEFDIYLNQAFLNGNFLNIALIATSF
ncbi:hypothetical protein GJ496_009652, partial [Pomphorhynchus laevis]